MYHSFIMINRDDKLHVPLYFVDDRDPCTLIYFDRFHVFHSFIMIDIYHKLWGVIGLAPAMRMNWTQVEGKAV